MKEIDGYDLNYYLECYELGRVFSEDFRPQIKVCQFKKGNVLFSAGEELEELYILVEGKIKIFTLTPEGKSLINRFKRPLELIGDVEYVKRNAVFNSVEAVTDGVMLAASFADLEKLEKDHPPFMRFLLETLARKFYTESHTTSLNMLYPVEVRLASYLLSISSVSEGTAFHQEMHTSNLTELAEWLGTSYRHLNRVLKKMALDDIIERANGTITIKDLEKLSILAKGNIYE
ncbi:cAMP-binding domain of CRP or a regulatory subunit of cAMP-dependent protein kinases [Thalassobacillus cyri]|uniref:cAMP-binding domain of CRP or a regulatory subunit of cAMP-dependent protein kinases n=1 Tax=Thalassobacillus cyri TaxID=571932 RepID=A0A1H3XXB2_9BACI|nr:Crp/Fnr family transcriptional regulator [Thalassobacillus cyri]SEA03148.1 cAMP-binding domain of CRP or a regulatory subunit of cAMP-dependent protein kinases [Thalassobacillus cyri]